MEIIDDLKRLKEGDWIKISDANSRGPFIAIVEKLINPVGLSNVFQVVYQDRHERVWINSNYERKEGLFQIVHKEKRAKRFKSTKLTNIIYRGNEFLYHPKNIKYEWQMKMVEQFNRRDQVIIHRLNEDEINKIKAEEILKALERQNI